MKKIIPFILALCAMLVLFAGCDSNPEPAREPISEADAVQIVLGQIEEDITEADPHVHVGTYEGKDCYLVYVTVEGENLVISVDQYTGEILNVARSYHSH